MSPEPLGPVVIGAREIYDQVVLIGATVREIGGKLDEHGNDLKDHEARLRALERNRWPLPALSVLVSIAALVLAWISARH